MSILINESLDPNIISANFLAKCVLPIPVGPKNINTPMGWLGSFKPTRLRCMALTILLMAASWAITLFLSRLSISLSRLPSASSIRSTGTPAIKDIVLATSFSVIIAGSLCSPFNHDWFNWLSSCSKRLCSSRNLAANSKFWFLTASRFFCVTSATSFSFSSIEGGILMFCKCTFEPTSSNASMALSGKERSVR